MVSQQKTGEQALQNPDVINLARIAEHERNVLNTSLVAKYFADKFSITSISALQTISFGYKDLDFPGIYHSFYDGKIGELLPPQKVFSQEFRINSTANSKLQYTAGLYGFTQKGYEPTTNLAYEFTPTSFAIFRNRSKNAGIAAFGEASYQLSAKIKATAGLRYDYEKREATFNGFGDATFINGVITDVVPDTTAKGNYTALSPKFALSYSVNKKSNIYVSYTRGFRTGGVNAQRYPANLGIRQTFDPEYSNNYEVGYKTSLANNKVYISASAFLIQWKALQLFNLAAPFAYARQNLGDAQSMGLEMEVSAIAAKGLQLDGSFGLNKTEYKEFSLKRPGLVTPIGGNRLSNAPSHTIFLGTQYEFSVSKKLKAVVRGEVRNMGNFYTDIQNTIKQPAYTVINSRVGLSSDKYSLFFWVQNLNNKRFLAFGTQDTSFGNSVRTAAPRTLGVTLSAKF
jgi:iron complex outermembrane receptor protein